ncbi:MAG TPA: TolC family protein [Prolixibacteraceae bacterium]|nr:TolC family protein [Prolixibacteraceae bacterium]
MKKIISSIFLILMVVISQGQQQLPVFEAIQKALRNNYDIQLQAKDREVATIRNNWGTAGRYPSFSFSASSNNKADFNETDDFNQFQLVGGVSLNWTLFNGFKVNITKSRLEDLEELSEGNTAILIEQTVQSVIMAYNSVLLEQKKLDVYTENVQLSNDRLEYEKMRKDLGNAVSYEVLQAQNSYLADKSQAMLQKANVKAAMRELVYLMGEENILYELTDDIEADTVSYNNEELLSVMLNRNKNLQNQYVAISLAEKETNLAKANYYPTISLNAGGQVVDMNQNYNNGQDRSSLSSNVYGNLSLSYSIFNGGVRKRAVQIAKIEEEAAYIEQDEMELSLTNQLYQLLDFYEARKSMLKLADERLEVAQLNLDISSQKLKAGTINSFNYRDVQLTYQNAANAYFDALYNLIDVQTSILRLTGQMVNEDGEFIR